jgi:group I intron endonuclease
VATGAYKNLPDADKTFATVYIITNSVNGKRYVGVTKRSLRKRLLDHFYKARKGADLFLSMAIRKYGADAFDILPLEEVTLDDAYDSERKWIERLSPEYNMTGGGDGVRGLTMSEKSKALMVEKKIGRKRGPQSEEHRRAISEGQKGKILSEDHKHKLRLAWNKRRLIGHSEETKRKMSMSHRNKSPEEKAAWIEKLVAKRIGRKLSEETKAKISASHRARHMP